ncbi:hypothetical protein H8B13_19440 [Hymenobacter sp. BT188]|nr:hypothetical protein [Hymenobacter sp. BT188]
MENYYPSGALKSTVEWKNDRQHGVAKSYYETGQLEEVSHWRNDTLAGPCKMFYPNGNLEKLSHYEHNVIVGDRILFDDKGNPMQKEIYDAQGRLIYIASYDNHSRQQPGLVTAVFTDQSDQSDSITSERLLKTMVNFGFKLSGEVKMIVGKINSKTGEVIDTSQVLTRDSNGHFIVYTKPNKNGETRISYKFLHLPSNNKDTLSVNGTRGTHVYNGLSK